MLLSLGQCYGWNVALGVVNVCVSGRRLTESKVVGLLSDYGPRSEDEPIVGWPRLLTWAALILAGGGLEWAYLTIWALRSEDFLTAALLMGPVFLVFQVTALVLNLVVYTLIRQFRKQRFYTTRVSGWGGEHDERALRILTDSEIAPNFLRRMDDFIQGEDEDAKEDLHYETGGRIFLTMLCILGLGGVLAGMMACAADKQFYRSIWHAKRPLADLA